MINNIQTIITAVVAIVIGLVIGFLVSEIRNISIKNQLERERDNAITVKNTIREQWQKAVDELEQTRVLLNDTLAALEVLKSYQLIDSETQKDIDELEETLDDEGSPTPETYNKFKSLVDRFNELNQEYNTGAATAFTMSEEDEIDIRPFVELKQEAQRLFEEATEIVLKFKDGE